MALKAEKGLTQMSAPAIDQQTSSEAGFTLLEALMVLVIVGLLAGAAALATPAPSARAAAEAERLAARLVLARQDSVLRNRVVGLMMTDQGYGFGRLEAPGWAPIEDAGPLRYRALPDAIEATLLEPEGQEGLAVPVRFDPLGAATPFAAEVEGGGAAFVVSVSAAGTVDVERVR